MSPKTLRRYRTAKKIQAAAVMLAVRDGLPNVTTEAIARLAGISTRTFFNYYPYKEAALAGPPPDYPAEAAEDFVNGSGTLIDDLTRLIEMHLARFVNERDMLADMFRLSETDAKLGALLNSALVARRAQMRELLSRRIANADPRMVEILAAAIVAATSAATKDWVAGNKTDFLAAARDNLSLIVPSAEMLHQTGTGGVVA